MNNKKAALDTNFVIGLLNNEQDIIECTRIFEILCIPLPVLGEVLYGALNSTRIKKNTAEIQALIVDCRLLEIKETTARFYAQIRIDLKRKGKPIPVNDLWIAALCLEHQIPLATKDEHFSRVRGLEIFSDAP
jgi:tRNA(fMet)-specific endonuclease VapC